MGFLRKLFGKGEEPSTWAPFFQPDELTSFLDQVEQNLRGRGLDFRLDRATGRVQYRDGDEIQNLGLLNLAQRCRQLARGDWPEAIHTHLEILVTGSPKVVSEMDTLAADFNRACEALRTRLQRTDFAPDLASVVTRPVAEGLVEVLTYDFPESVAYVPPSHPNGWGVPLDEVFSRARQRVRDAGLLPRQALELPGGIALDLLEDEENFFASTHVFFLNEYYQPAPELGCLVAVPHRHAIVAYPIQGAEVRRMLAGIAFLANGLFEQGPGSISPNVYWWDRERLHHIPSHPTEDGFSFTYPAAFQSGVLAQIGG
jgi:hypothetical protein